MEPASTTQMRTVYAMNLRWRAAPMRRLKTSTKPPQMMTVRARIQLRGAPIPWRAISTRMLRHPMGTATSILALDAPWKALATTIRPSPLPMMRPAYLPRRTIPVRATAWVTTTAMACAMNSKFRDVPMRWRSTMIRVQRIWMVHARTPAFATTKRRVTMSHMKPTALKLKRMRNTMGWWVLRTWRVIPHTGFMPCAKTRTIS